MAGDDFDICVIGAGSGGLSVAYAASHMGQKVALIEGHRMGGDCLNFGCVPSKALLAAAHAAQGMRDAGRFGIAPVEPQVDFAAVHGHVHGVTSLCEWNGRLLAAARGSGRIVSVDPHADPDLGGPA